jgi:hypothetical protein
VTQTTTQSYTWNKQTYSQKHNRKKSIYSVHKLGKIREVRQLNIGVIDVQKLNVQVEILGCKGAKKIGMR